MLPGEGRLPPPAPPIEGKLDPPPPGRVEGSVLGRPPPPEGRLGRVAGRVEGALGRVAGRVDGAEGRVVAGRVEGRDPPPKALLREYDDPRDVAGREADRLRDEEERAE